MSAFDKLHLWCSAVENMAEKMKTLGDELRRVRSEFSEEDFQIWLRTWCPRLLDDRDLVTDAMDYARECGEERSFAA